MSKPTRQHRAPFHRLRVDVRNPNRNRSAYAVRRKKGYITRTFYLTGVELIFANDKIRIASDGLDGLTYDTRPIARLRGKRNG